MKLVKLKANWENPLTKCSIIPSQNSESPNLGNGFRSLSFPHNTHLIEIYKQPFLGYKISQEFHFP